MAGGERITIFPVTKRKEALEKRAELAVSFGGTESRYDPPRFVVADPRCVTDSTSCSDDAGAIPKGLDAEGLGAAAADSLSFWAGTKKGATFKTYRFLSNLEKDWIESGRPAESLFDAIAHGDMTTFFGCGKAFVAYDNVH